MKTTLFYRQSKSLNDASSKAITPYAQGPAVRQLQQSLNRRLKALGISDLVSLRVDGWFGDKTLAAVKYLQCAAGLPVNGHATSLLQAFLVDGFSGLETLSLGSTGTSVSAVKQTLCTRSSVQLALDNNFCETTQQAVKRYQQSAGLKADGVVGEKTWGVIVRSRLSGLPCSLLTPNVYINISPKIL